MSEDSDKPAVDQGGISRRSLLNSLALLPLAGSVGAVSGRAVEEAVLRKPAGSKPHIAVIGAGAFGGWTALHLVRQGAEVTLFDTWGPGNSRSSSGGDTRVIRSLYGGDRIYVELVRRSFELWRQSGQQWGQKLYHRIGALWMFGDDDDYAAASIPLVTAAGLRVDKLSGDEASQRFSQVNFDGVESVYYEHEAGYLSARRACRVVVDGFITEGGTYRQRTVRPGRRQSGALSGIVLSDGSSLSADQYVFACGPWLGRLFPEAIGSRIHSTRQETFYFGTPPGQLQFSENRLPVWVDFTGAVFYGIPGAEGRGFKVADDTRGAAFDPTAGDRTPTDAGIETARRFLARRFPGMEGAPLLEARVCQYENSPDGHFIVDRHPEAANVWLVGGGSGHGFKLSPALGESVAQAVLGRSTIDPFFSLKRLADPNSLGTQFQTGKKPGR